MKTSRLYLWNGKALFFTSNLDTKPHQHHALQIAIGLDKAFLIRTKKSEPWGSHRISVIAPDQPHQIDARNTAVISLYVDMESHLIRQLIPDIQNHKIRFYDFEQIKPLLSQLWHCGQGQYNCDAALQLTDRIVQTFSPLYAPISELDTRVQHALEIIHSLSEKNISAQALASQVFLSSSRLAHLFREQTGLSIRRYLLWERLLEAIRQMMEESDLSKAAHEAGFADSAHMSRTFQQMFGVAPSGIFKNDQFQLTLCSS